MGAIKRMMSALLAVAGLQCAAVSYASDSTEQLFGDAVVIYVSPGGSDKNNGTLEKPLATMKGARDAVRKINTDKEIYVVFRDGEYTARETVEFTSADSGKNKVVYMSYPGENAVFNGGVRVREWQFYKDGIYTAEVEAAENFRELYVDGKRQPRAATKLVQGMGFDENQTAVKVLTSDLPEHITNQDCLETMNTYKWRQYWLPIERVFKEGNYTKLYYDTKEIQTYTSRFNFEWTGETYFRVENALEFLDEEGEWYFDKYEKRLYYKPEAGTDITQSEIYAPIVEKFIDIRGESINEPIENLEIRNMTFLYGGWTYPAEGGYCSVQATSVVHEDGGAYAKMTPGHIEVNYAKNFVFSGNTMAHMAVVGLNAENAVFDTAISGNVFYDIGASAVTVGSTKHSLDDRIKEIPDNITTDNNIIRYTGMGYFGAPGITYYYTTNSKIVHNDIQNATYSGISIGWGWCETPIQHDNLIGYNKIGNFNTKVIDGAAIYSLSSNVNSGYVGNYVFGVNAPFNSGALYHDQNSRGFEDYDNVIDSENPSYLMYNLNDNDEIIIRDTYTNTLNIVNYKREGKDIKVYNIHYVKNDEWPERAVEIMRNAGPESEYYNDVYGKLEAVDEINAVRKPILRALGVSYVEANLFYPLYQSYADKSDLKAPFNEENGSVVFDAIDINGEYIGYDVSKKAFVGVLGNENWVGNYTARGALMIQSCQYDIENAHKLTGKPRVGYKVNFNTPGKYYVFAKARALGTATDAVTVYLDDNEIGKLSVHNDFSWCGKNSTGDLVMEITEPGVYEIEFETMSDIYLDRLWFTQTPSADLYDGSISMGPVSSKRYSENVVHTEIPVKLGEEELPKPLEERTNIALNKPATASSYLELAPGYNPYKAVNGIFTDDWLTEITNENAWWQVDLEKRYDITEIGLVFRTTANQPATRRNFEVLASNDEDFGTYTKLYDSAGTTVGFKEVLSIPVENNEKFRYIRVRKTAREAMGIAECRVYSEANEAFEADEMYFSSVKAGRYGTANAVDNDISTHWSEGFAKNYWIKFSNASNKAISKIKLYIRDDVNIPELFEDFEVRASNEFNFENYTVLADSFIRNGNVLTATADDPNGYKYIMLIKKQGFIGISEVKLFTRGEALDGEETALEISE